MKIYVSADIEGITGIANWNEATKEKPDYPPFSGEMLREVRAACDGANNAGADEIWIKDAHDTGRNLSMNGLPANTRLIRAWSGHPFFMMQELDDTYDAALLLGYHSYAGSDGNPLAHTINPELSCIKINGEPASEFLINSYTASLVNVPVVFVSGDFALCEHAERLNAGIKTVRSNKGAGGSVIAFHPDIVTENIRQGVEEALKSPVRKCMLPLPGHFEVELCYNLHTRAYKASFYPGMKMLSARSLMFETDSYFEVLRMLAFAV